MSCLKNFDGIPEIYSYDPLVMELVDGKNIYEYTYLPTEQKKYVLEKIEVCNPTSMYRALKTLKATCHRLEYHGYSETLTPSLWWFSHDELARIYQAIMDNVASEGLDMIKKTGTEVEA